MQSRAKKFYIERPEQPPLQASKLIIQLFIRVTTQELNQGRWAIKEGAGALGEREVVDRLDQTGALGRGKRVQKPHKAV